MAVAEEAVRMAEAADDRYGLAYSQSRVGLIYLRQGDPERAIPWLERSLDGSRRFNFELLSLIAAGPLGEARAACGETVEAFALLEQAAEQAASMSRRSCAGVAMRMVFSSPPSTGATANGGRRSALPH